MLDGVLICSVKAVMIAGAHKAFILSVRIYLEMLIKPHTAHVQEIVFIFKVISWYELLPRH